MEDCRKGDAAIGTRPDSLCELYGSLEVRYRRCKSRTRACANRHAKAEVALAYQRICSDPRSLHAAKKTRSPPYHLHEVQEIVVQEEICRIYAQVVGSVEVAGSRTNPNECVAWVIRRLLWDVTLRSLQTHSKTESRQSLDWRSCLDKLITWRRYKSVAFLRKTPFSLRTSVELSRREKLA